ncbi:MAG: XdhC family protein [Oscillospiraceae bacterium]|nr:XdhC family protein [Oscillospiraceae bacterium]
MHFDFKRVYDSAVSRVPEQIEFDAEGETYVRRFTPSERLILLGAGHIGQSVCNFAAQLEFSVIAVDDRASFANKTRFPDAAQVICDSFENAIDRIDICPGDYVCVITRGHRYDADCLRKLLKGTMPKYLGMIGSKRRTVELLNMLESEGYDRQRLNMIHTPIGVPINALTVPEIAISIVAELIACRREQTNRRSKSTLLTNESVDMELLKYLAENDEPKALLVVYASSGSTPAKPGSVMAINKDYVSHGTIGGGCSENAVMMTAYKLIGTGKTVYETIDMSNDVAEDEGMVCGGKMRVMITDLT